MKDLICPYCKGRMEHVSTIWELDNKQLDSTDVIAEIKYECVDCGGTFKKRIVKEVKL